MSPTWKNPSPPPRFAPMPPTQYRKAGYATVASFRSPEEWPNEDGCFRPHSLHEIAATAGWPNENGTVDTIDFPGLCSDQHLCFSPCWIEHLSLIMITPTSSNFGWELFILWVISYGLSFSVFAIDLSLIQPRNSGNRANPENDSP